MNLRLATLLLSILFIGELIYLSFNSGEMTLYEDPFSALGNLDGNYGLFLFGTSVLLFIFTLILRRMFVLANTKNIWEIYLFPLLGIVSLLVHYNEDVILSRVIHTIFGVASAIVLVWIIYKFNKVYSPKNILKKKFLKFLPSILLFGTLIVFFIFGLNSIMEIFYGFFLLLWINLVNFTLEKEVKVKMSRKVSV